VEQVIAVSKLHFLQKSRPNFAKTKSGANGKFLPKPLLFHLLLFLFWGNSGGQHKKAVSRFDLFEILA